LQVGGSSVGSINAWWLASEYFTEVAESADVPRFALYKVPNAAHPTTEVHFRVGVVEDSTMDPGERMVWDWRVEMYEDGVLLGWKEQRTYILTTFEPGFLTNVPNPASGDWNDLVDPLRFTRMWFQFRNSTWDEQTDYHPYRH